MTHKKHEIAVFIENEEKCELIAEELKICMGFDIEVFKDKFTWKLKLETIAGVLIYEPSEPTYMGDVFRFISHYGGKLSKWGLASKISEYNNPPPTRRNT